jgi:predicted CopG family antitoxin
MSRIISVSDEVYLKLSGIKDDRSFTEVIKSLLSGSANKGDAKEIIAFVKSAKPVSKESAKRMLNAVKTGRKNAVARDIFG